MEGDVSESPHHVHAGARPFCRVWRWHTHWHWARQWHETHGHSCPFFTSHMYIVFQFPDLPTFFLQVEHAFKSWKTKSWETGKRDSSGAASVCYFSSDNYGDCTVKETQGTGPFAKAVVKTNPHASRFLKTTKDLTEKHWAEIFAAATKFLKTRHKQKWSQSASSHASSDFIEETMPEYSYLSDSDWVLISITFLFTWALDLSRQLSQ